MKATDKIQLLERVRTIEGLTDVERNALITLINENKTYGLVWEDKPENVEKRLEIEYPVLTEVRNREIISDNPDAPNHILIEGDNLEALTTLAFTHAGKIDVIYIDPPYNTGNKDFVYNDTYVDPEDSYRHSKWLSFMSRRLRIAKKLLSDRGVIFISIDDNEIGQLKVICDELFKSRNSFGTLVWDLGTGTSAGHFTRSHEFVLAYCKNKSLLPNFEGGDGIIDDRAIKKLSAKNHKFDYTFKAGTKFEADDGTEFCGEWGGSEKTELVSGRFYCRNGQLAEDVTLSACWTQKNQMDSFFSGKETFDSKGQIVIEFYFRENGKLYCRKCRSKLNPPSVLRGVATTKQGSATLKEIFANDELFSFAKPVQLVSYLLKLIRPSHTILDFFAGSGTTLHAVMQLNAEDGGHRQCILCTNNENDICENVTYERNRRVIKGYKKPNGDVVPGLTDNNLRYYRTEFVSREHTQKNRHTIMDKSTELLCIKEDLYTEQSTFGHIKLNPNGARFFRNHKKQMLVIYHSEFVPYFVAEIDKMDVQNPIKVYVYSPGKYAYDDEFAIVSDKVNVYALPQNIIDAMVRVLPEKPTECTLVDATPTLEQPAAFADNSLFNNLED